MIRAAAAFALFALLASAPAMAFTSESQSGSSTAGASNFSDPDEQFDSDNGQGAGSPLGHLSFGNGTSASFGVNGPNNSSGLSPCVANGDCARSAIH